MPYAVIAPGISTVYKNWRDVERIIALYPYPKFRKFSTEGECWEYVRRYTYKRICTDVTKYGDTFNKMCVTMEYFIRNDAVYYNFHTKKLGYVAIECDDENVDVVNRVDNIKVKLNNICVSDELITGHLIAIWNGLKIIGDYVDVDICVPDHSIFYALMTYKGGNRIINRVRKFIAERTAKVSVTLKDFGG